MQNISLKRITQLIKKELIVNNLFYNAIGSMAIAFCLGIFFDIDFSISGALLIGICVRGLSVFQKESGTSDFFLLPAGLKEKFIAFTITWFIIFPVIIFISIIVGMFLGIKLLGKPFSLDGLVIVIMVFYFFQAFMFWSNIRFRKNGIWKVLLIIGLIALYLGILIFSLTIFLEIMYPHFEALWRHERLITGNLRQEIKTVGIIVYVFTVVSIWISGYLSLKEREI